MPPVGDADRKAVESSLETWAALARPRRVLLASPCSFCAGVERAIQIVEELLDRTDGTVYVRKQIVHNAHVVRDLESRGAVFVEEVAEVPIGAAVVFSAHGVSSAVYAEAAARDLRVIDAACPLVTKVHAEARRFAAGGDTIVLIGHAGHEEAEGTMGQAPSRTVLVETADDVARLGLVDPGQVAYLIDDAGDIRPEWLTGVDTVGLTAGASAPPALVNGVIAALSGLGPVSVTERETSRETVHFAVPSQVLRS